jgi:Fic-DOC domain mobile mystery protein B
MGLNFGYKKGNTLLEEDETDGLIIPSVSTCNELNEWEQNNIEQALLWLVGRSFSETEVFTEKFVCAMHYRMYSDVWSWAGKFRISNKNLGCDFWKIQLELNVLLEDVKYWVQHSTYSPDEIALRFKHRIVSIHCFPNGNGRHSRLMADLIIEKLYKQPVFTWGSISGRPVEVVRKDYLEALRNADKSNYDPLLRLARA